MFKIKSVNMYEVFVKFPNIWYQLLPMVHFNFKSKINEFFSNRNLPVLISNCFYPSETL